MTLRYLAVVLLLAAIGAGLLGLRQQQLNDKHAIAQWHSQMKQDREQIKDLQVRIAKLTRPEALQDALDGTRLRFEPVTTQPTQTQDPSVDAEAALPTEDGNHDG